jgi:hypothetical protein
VPGPAGAVPGPATAPGGRPGRPFAPGGQPGQALAAPVNGEALPRPAAGRVPQTGGWSIDPTPGNQAPTGAFEAVSCAGARSCEAVGYYDNSADDTAAPFAESWNGTAWTLQSVPLPAGGNNGWLAGVSCTSATSCIAVGYYTGTSPAASGRITLADQWNGTAWSVLTTPFPPEAGSVLYGVSCFSATDCTAVGYYEAGTTYLALAERWNGTAWSIQATQATNGPATYLQSVSCRSATACVAVGQYDNSGVYLAIAESWNGSTWRIQFTPVTGGQYNYLDGVSCQTATTCVAVGGYYESKAKTYVTLAESWNGSVWTIASAPATGGTSAALYSVSCRSATACTAAGSYDNSSGTQVTLAERWDGTAWSIQPTPNPAGSLGSVFYAISCTSATACTGVGNTFVDPVGNETMAETWNGTTWTVQPTPNANPFPDNGYGSFLYGVSCQTASVCTAVGIYGNGSFGNHFTLAETEN